MEFLIILCAIIAYVMIAQKKNSKNTDEIQHTFNAAMKDLITLYVTTGQNILKIANSPEFYEDNIDCHMRIMNELVSTLAAVRQAYGLNHIPGSMASFYVKGIGEKNFYYIHAANLYLISELRKSNDRNYVFTTIENFSMRAAPNLNNFFSPLDQDIEKPLPTDITRQDTSIVYPNTAERGLLAVKAASYLQIIETGEGADYANAQVRDLSADSPTSVIMAAMDFISSRYEGKQLPMIAAAREKGFTG